VFDRLGLNRPNLDRPGPEREGRDVAVVDIGSNSVRLVLYRVDGRAIWTVFNEKVLAGLGRGVAATRRLSPAGTEAALTALRRFRAVLDGARPHQVFAVATAAVREADDGAAFVERIRRETGLIVRVLTGEEEARISALGVVAGQPDAHGVVGDLGGSSLELTGVVHGVPGPGVSLPLGPFALGAPKAVDPGRVRQVAAAVIDEAARAYRHSTFHAVGGAWRNVALVHMTVTGYPLRIVHQYEMSAGEALDSARLIARQSRGSLERIQGVSKKRAETLPYAALVLELLVERLGIERVVLSAYGLREGLIYEAMKPAVRDLDPLVEGCAALGRRQGVAERLGPALESWLRPFWLSLAPVPGPAAETRMLAAACRLADVGARLHPDHRAELVFDQVLRAPIAGQTHAERAFLAAAVFGRYSADPGAPETALGRMLGEEQLRRARGLGAAMRLGCDLSGGSPDLLAASALTRTGNTATLIARGDHGDLLLGEQTGKRLTALAAALGMDSALQRA